MVKKTIELIADIGEHVYLKEDAKEGKVIPYKVVGIQILESFLDRTPTTSYYLYIADTYSPLLTDWVWYSEDELLSKEEAKEIAIEYHKKALKELTNSEQQGKGE